MDCRGQTETNLPTKTEEHRPLVIRELVAERRIELLISRLSIECFEPTKLLRNEPKSGIEPLTSCVPGRRSSN